jgi:ATP-dependent RNA circularization protein (DNA/RNA ligase family)
MKYPKIDTLWKRDKKEFRIIEGTYSKEEFANIKHWHITEKIDGTNIRIIFDRAESGLDRKTLYFEGRTERAQIPTHLFRYLQDTFTYNLLSETFEETQKVILFGEGHGPKIQKGGGLYSSEPSFVLFDVWVNNWWLTQDSVSEIASKLNIKSAPVIGIMTTDGVVEYVKNKPKSILAEKEKESEGIVARSHPLMLFRNGKPIMWKLKVKDYEEFFVK